MSRILDLFKSQMKREERRTRKRRKIRGSIRKGRELRTLVKTRGKTRLELLNWSLMKVSSSILAYAPLSSLVREPLFAGCSLREKKK